MKVPNPVLAVIAEVLANAYSHDRLNVLFAQKGAPGDPPAGSKPAKCHAWLNMINAEPRTRRRSLER